MNEPGQAIFQASVVAIGDKALAITGPPGSGKSMLALALLDRGAKLIGDDAVTLARSGGAIIASPPPNIEGMLEIRGVGIVKFPLARPSPLALILTLTETTERLPEIVPAHDILGLPIPHLDFVAGHTAAPQRAEWALKLHGLSFPD